MTPFVLANSDGPSGEGSRSEFDFSDGSAITLMEELNCDSQDEGIKYLVHHIVGQEKGAPAEVTPELIPGHELDTTNVNPTMGDKAVEFLAVNFADEKPGVSSSPLVVTTDTKAIALDVATIGSLFANAGGNAVVSMSIDGGKAVKLTPFEAGHIALPDGAKKLDISVTNTETGKTVTYTKEIVVADSAQAANSSGSGFSVIFLVIAALLALLIAAGVTAQRRKSQVSAE